MTLSSTDLIFLSKMWPFLSFATLKHKKSFSSKFFSNLTEIFVSCL